MLIAVTKYTHVNFDLLVDQLFAEAYNYPLPEPGAHQCRTIFDVINWLVRQRDMASRFFHE